MVNYGFYNGLYAVKATLLMGFVTAMLLYEKDSPK